MTSVTRASGCHSEETRRKPVAEAEGKEGCGCHASGEGNGPLLTPFVPHAPGHDECCCGSHAAPASFEPAPLGAQSATRAVYRIMNMDCPMEEALIRKKLGSMPGVTGLEFNLMQRLLTVDHQLASTEPIESALRSIDMAPENGATTAEEEALFSVAGMERPTEEALIKSRLSGLPGVQDLECDLNRRTVRIRYAPGTLPAVSEALASLNLNATLIEAGSNAAAELPETHIPWVRLAVAGVLAGLAEVLHFMGRDMLPLDAASGGVLQKAGLEWGPLVLAVIAILLSGLGTYRKGWIAVRNLNLNINALMSVAVTGAVITGQYSEAAMVMVLFTLAEAIEAKSLQRARKAISDLVRLTPERATVRASDGEWADVDIRQVAVGTRVRVRPGEKVALDGVVVQGRSTVNQAPITGESLPVEKKDGDTVYAGTINESGSFEFEVTAAADNSTLARIIHAVEEAQGSRAPIQRFVDRFARVYTPAVFLTALLVAVLPPLLMDGAWTEWVYTALVILVIGCPCALVISTPVSIVSGMAAATRHGILIKGGMFLEQGRLLQSLALDKTGTITHGKPVQTDFVLCGDLVKEQAFALAAGLASRSDHPVSQAIARAALAEGVTINDVTDFEALPGQGVRGKIQGDSWSLGNGRMAEALGHVSSVQEGRILELERQGKSVVALVGPDGVQALLAVADTVKESSVEAVRELRRLGIKTVMLTGDNQHTARVIAEQVGVDDYQSDLLPGDKQSAIEALRANGPAGMVGDGINDAPALASADIGFAMASAGTDTAIETADVALMDDDLRKIPRFVRLSRATYGILMQNIVLALGVKAVFLTLAFFGLATMWMAVFADVGTSLLVVANGLRAMRL